MLLSVSFLMSGGRVHFQADRSKQEGQKHLNTEATLGFCFKTGSASPFSDIYQPVRKPLLSKSAFTAFPFFHPVHDEHRSNNMSINS